MFNSQTAEHLDVDSNEDVEVDDVASEPVEEAEETVVSNDGGVVYVGIKENGQLIVER